MLFEGCFGLLGEEECVVVGGEEDCIECLLYLVIGLFVFEVFWCGMGGCFWGWVGVVML